MTNIPSEISNFFLAMQAGASGAATMEAVLADDAIYVEPFSGTVQQHQGKPAILAVMRQGWSFNPPDMHIAIDRAELVDGAVLVDWTCYASTLPGGKGSGTNHFTLRDGKVVRLETTFR